jgi:hypothetical protein
VLATWKSARDGTATDWPAIAAEGIRADALPELVAKHTTPTTGSRRFLLKD